MMLYIDEQALNKEDDTAFLKLLYEKCPEIKQVEEMVKEFKELFIKKKDGALKAWIEEAVKPIST